MACSAGLRTMITLPPKLPQDPPVPSRLETDQHVSCGEPLTDATRVAARGRTPATAERLRPRAAAPLHWRGKVVGGEVGGTSILIFLRLKQYSAFSPALIRAQLMQARRNTKMADALSEVVSKPVPTFCATVPAEFNPGPCLCSRKVPRGMPLFKSRPSA